MLFTFCYSAEKDNKSSVYNLLIKINAMSMMPYLFEKRCKKRKKQKTQNIIISRTTWTRLLERLMELFVVTSFVLLHITGTSSEQDSALTNMKISPLDLEIRHTIKMRRTTVQAEY